MQALRRILGLRESEANELTSAKTAPLPKPASAGKLDPSVVSDNDTKPTKPAPTDGTTAPLPETTGRTRQLEPLEDVPKSTSGSRLNVGLRSHVGQVRDNNQDAMSYFASTISSAEERPDFGLFVVADGMGGHEDGEKASGFAARIISKNVIKDIYLPLLADGSLSSDSQQKPLTEILKNAVQKANEYISVHVPDGGTTVTAVTILGNLAHVAHVGDSRAYLITSDGIEQLTRDHSLVQRLIELGQLTPEEAIEHPQRNVLYRAIGQSDQLDVDAMTRHLAPGSYLLVCSDGLWNLVSSEELLTIVLNHGSNTQLACQTLVDLANERGGSDNITVILVRIPD